MTELRDLLERLIEDPAASWAVGSYGAIAEFHWDAGEARRPLSPLGVATARGALRIAPEGPVAPLAWEAPAAHGAPWVQGLAFCLPAQEARMGGRRTLTRLEDREEGALFDIGVGAPHVDACVLAPPELARALSEACGRSIWDADSPALALLKEAAPPRLFRSRIAEVRVDQRIGSRARKEPNPEGPHTHVLRDLVARGLAFDEAIPVPPGSVPALYCYPAHAARDGLGRPRLFDAAAYDAFQGLLERYGPAGFLARKRAYFAHAEGRGPLPEPSDRAVARVALAQLEARGLAAGRASELASAWGAQRRPAAA